MKKLNFNTDMTVRVHLRVIFHDRRLQNTEQEQIMQWTKNRPCERFLEIDIPPSENINNVSQTAKGAIILWKKEAFFYINNNDFYKKIKSSTVPNLRGREIEIVLLLSRSIAFRPNLLKRNTGVKKELVSDFK